jgi:hypothetical protein
MRRREFLGLVGSAIAASPRTARARQPAPSRRIGLLMGWSEEDPGVEAWLATFREIARPHNTAHAARNG